MEIEKKSNSKTRSLTYSIQNIVVKVELNPNPNSNLNLELETLSEKIKNADYDKYGEERFYYPEETIMSTTSDCEDKAMLMSYLTHNILGLKSIGLFYKQDEHLSLGIEIPGYAPHGSFKYSGKTYVSCEPTAPTPRIPQSQFSLQRVDEVIEF